jgi:hypothetical protein
MKQRAEVLVDMYPHQAMSPSQSRSLSLQTLLITRKRKMQISKLRFKRPCEIWNNTSSNMLPLSRTFLPLALRCANPQAHQPQYPRTHMSLPPLKLRIFISFQLWWIGFNISLLVQFLESHRFRNYMRVSAHFDLSWHGAMERP